MDIAIITSKILLELEIEIRYPIVDIVASSPCGYQGFCGGIIADVSSSLTY
jgi:hypothetical protein